MKKKKNDLKTLFNRPNKFFEKYNSRKLWEMPYIYLVVSLYVFSIFIERIEKLEVAYNINLLAAIFVFIISVLIYFYLGTFVYKLRLKFCGGNTEDNLVKKIYLFTKLFVNLYIGLIFFIGTLMFILLENTPLFTDNILYLGLLVFVA